MRCLVIVKASKDSEAEVMPSTELMTAMGNYNEQLVKAGVLEAGEGLRSTSHGARVAFPADGSQGDVTKGPFNLTEDTIAGYWIFKVQSLEEAIEWVKKAPSPMPGVDTHVEIRPIFGMEDFGDQFTPELREQEERMRKQLDSKNS